MRKSSLERPDILGGDSLFRYDFASKFCRNKDVLDVGTGFGFGAYRLFKKGAKKVTGIDSSNEAIDFAKKNLLGNKLHFATMDALKLTFPDSSFDVVVALEVIEHIPVSQQASFIKNIKRVLKREGLCLISTPNKLITSPKDRKPLNPYHFKEYLPWELKGFLEENFSDVSLLGLKLINKFCLEKQRKLGQLFRYRIFGIMGRFRLFRELVSFIPKSMKMKISGEDRLPILRPDDFKIFRKKIEDCDILLALNRK